MILRGFVYSGGEMGDASAFCASGSLLAAAIRELSEKVGTGRGGRESARITRVRNIGRAAEKIFHVIQPQHFTISRGAGILPSTENFRQVQTRNEPVVELPMNFGRGTLGGGALPSWGRLGRSRAVGPSGRLGAIWPIRSGPSRFLGSRNRGVTRLEAPLETDTRLDSEAARARCRTVPPGAEGAELSGL